MLVCNTDRFSHQLSVVRSLVDTVIVALDHPENIANRRSMIDCLALGNFHLQQLQEEIQYLGESYNQLLECVVSDD